MTNVSAMDELEETAMQMALEPKVLLFWSGDDSGTWNSLR